MTEVWLAFIFGLVGSPHCLGMCGGIVAALCMTNRQGPSRSRVLSQVFYNFGRIFTYTTLGAGVGLASGFLGLPTFRPGAAWLYCAINLVVIVIGLLLVFGMKWFSFYPMETYVGRLLVRPLRRSISGSSSLSAFPLGCSWAFFRVDSFTSHYWLPQEAAARYAEGC